MSIALDTPFKTDKSIRSVNFFNNRLLSAEDLNAEKTANRTEHKQLGRALGDGIVRGLEVSVQDKTLPALSISPGLAVNRNGRTVELSDEVVIELPTRPPTSNATTATVAEFEECLPPQAGVYLLNEGVFLLTIQPTEIPEGRAQVSGLDGKAAGCNIKYRVSAVKFRLISLDDQLKQELSESQAAINVAKAGVEREAERSRQNHLLRNRVAHRCFGTGDARLDSFIRDPFGATATDYGLLADLRQLSDKNPGKLTNCEVPLALVYWTRGGPQTEAGPQPDAGLQWLDMWSVRRRIATPDPSGFAWPLLAERRVSEGEAMLLQFEGQIMSIINDRSETIRTRVATDRFRYLPPAGILPIGGIVPAGGFRTSQGFIVQKFFSQQVCRGPVYVEGARVQSLIRESHVYPPIDLNSGELIWLYYVRENRQAIDENSPNLPQAYLLFANGHMPFCGDASFDVNRWEYSNFSLTLAA